MIYNIDGKFFILVSNKYKEIVVKKEKNILRVVPVKGGKVIERIHNDIKPQISVEEAYKKINNAKLD